MGPWGGVRGTAFDIPEAPLSLQTVTIGYGDVINSIAFSYTGQDGQTKTAGPWGGDGPLTTKVSDFVNFCIVWLINHYSFILTSYTYVWSN